MDTLIELVTELKKLHRDNPDLPEGATVSAVRIASAQIASALHTAKADLQALRAKQADIHGLSGLPGLIDLTLPVAVETPDGPLDAVVSIAYDATHDGPAVDLDTVDDEDADDEDDEDYDDAYEDFVPIPAQELIVLVAGVGPFQVDTVIEAVLPSVTSVLGAYTVLDGSVTTTGATLTAPDGEGVPEGTLPAGTVVFTGAVPNLGVTLTLTVSGEIDAENPPLDPAQVTAEILVQHAAELAMLGEQEPIGEVDEIHVVLTRLDRDELTLTDAQLIAPTAVSALSAVLGPHDVIEIVDGRDDEGFDADNVKVIRLRPAGNGPLDRRALSVGVAKFDGILPFAGVGRVRAHAVVA